jgi:Flp pilus assembly protein TadG
MIRSSRVRRRARGDRGAFAVELAVLAPVMLALFVLIWQAGEVVHAQNEVQSAARDLARYITSQSYDPSSTQTPPLPAEVSNYDCVTPTPQLTADPSSNPNAPTTSTVRVVLNCKVHLFGGITKTITAQALDRTDPYRSILGPTS